MYFRFCKTPVKDSPKTCNYATTYSIYHNWPCCTIASIEHKQEKSLTNQLV